MNEDNQYNRAMRLDISDIFYVASMSKELGNLARKQSRK